MLLAESTVRRNRRRKVEVTMAGKRALFPGARHLIAHRACQCIEQFRRQRHVEPPAIAIHLVGRERILPFRCELNEGQGAVLAL